MLSYMQTVSKNFTAGVQLIYHVSKQTLKLIFVVQPQKG